MVRVTSGLQRQRRHKKFRSLATGFRLGRKNVYKQLRMAVTRQGQYAYVHRKTKKRDFRKLWIERLSAAVREKGGTYSRFMGTLAHGNVRLDRKILSNIAIAFPAVFDKIYDAVTK